MINTIMEQLVLPGSEIFNEDILIQLGELSKAGKSCLLLMEHYSNFDLPALFYLLERQGSNSVGVANQIIAMAGAKLNEETSFVRAFTEAYSRIVIYPSRSIAKLDPATPQYQEEIGRARAINRAALHSMVRRKHEGHIILVFPAGTRYRPGEPETRRGLREIDSYIRSFDHILFVAIAGNTLLVKHDRDMVQDQPVQDVMIYYCDDKIIGSREFRDQVDANDDGQDPKQAVADAVMARLAVLNERATELRKQRLATLSEA
jgi:glycerol-3-phosphate O-acyltransferase